MCVVALVPPRPGAGWVWILKQQMVSRHTQRVGVLEGFCLQWLLNPGNIKLNYTRIATPVHAPGRCAFILTWAHPVIIIIITIPARDLGNQSCSQTGAMSFQGKKNNPRVAVRNVSDLNPRHRRVIAGCSNGDIVMLRRRRMMMVLLCIQGRASAAGNNLLSPNTAEKAGEHWRAARMHATMWHM